MLCAFCARFRITKVETKGGKSNGIPVVLILEEQEKAIMDGKKLEYFKDRLLQKRLSLTDMVQRTEGYSREKDQNIQDIADKAVESYTMEFNFSKSSGDRHVLQLIQEALDRIDNSSYGICVNCENKIQPKRLEAVPWTKLCIQCQELLEKGLLE